MNILVLGGTEFLGRHFVKIAKSKGHKLTLFSRGKTNPGLFTDVETIIGDRTKDLNNLNGKQFDVVLDTSGYFPANLKCVTTELKNKVNQYVFVSSCSVFDYNDQGLESFDENGTLVNLDIDKNKDAPETYGARKYHCEEVVRELFKDNHFIVRPGLIVGPFDPTYRFPYWADRISEGGEILCPGEPDAPLQFIDARDLSEWILFGIENRFSGTYNSVSPHSQLKLGQFLEMVKTEINNNCEFKWVSEQFLKENYIPCWSKLPLWVYKDIQGFLKLNSNKAISKGLKFRSISESIRDTHEWSKGIYKEQFLHKVLTRDKEVELLEKYRRSV